MRSRLAALALACAAAGVAAVGQAPPDDYVTGFRELAATQELTADVMYVNRKGMGQLDGRGALVCDAFGDRVFKPSAELTIKVDDLVVFKSNASKNLTMYENINGTGGNPVVSVYRDHDSMFGCMQITIQSGVSFPAAGRLSITGTFGSGPDMTDMFDDDQQFRVYGNYSLVGREGPQNIVMSMGAPLENKDDSFTSWHRDDVVPYVVSEPAVKLAVVPAAGTDTIVNDTTLFKLEFLAPSSGSPPPVRPQIKAITTDSFRVYVPPKFNTNDVTRWFITYAGPGAKFFSAAVVAAPGEEVPVDGLAAGTLYQVSACAAYTDTELEQTCEQLQATTKPFLGLQYTPVGNPEVFPLLQGNGVDISLPARQCANCTAFDSATVLITDVVDGTDLFTRTYTMGGLYREVGFDAMRGYNLRVSYQTSTGRAVFEDGFRPVTITPKPLGGSSGIGTPQLLRVSASSLVLRLPEQLNGSTSLIDQSTLVVVDAATDVVLVNTTIKGRARDFRINDIGSSGSLSTELTVTDTEGTRTLTRTVFNMVPADLSKRLVGAPSCSIMGNGDVEVDVPLRWDDVSARTKSVTARIVDPYDLYPDGVSSSLDGAGITSLINVPDHSVVARVDTTDIADVSKTLNTLLVAAEGAVAPVPEAGPPYVAAYTPSTVTVNVPGRLSNKDWAPVDDVEVEVADIMGGTVVASVSQDEGGSVVVDLPYSPQMMAIKTTIKSQQHKDAQEFTTVRRASGLPLYDAMTTDASVFFQNLPDNSTQRIVVRMPLQMGTAPAEIKVFDLFESEDDKRRRRRGQPVRSRGPVLTKTAVPGGDIVLTGYDVTNLLMVEITREGRTTTYSRPAPGSTLEYEAQGDFGMARVPHMVALQNPSDAPTSLPDRGIYDGISLIPALDAVVVRVTHLRNRVAVPYAKILVKSFTNGMCTGKTMATYEVGGLSDSFVPLPVGEHVDVCVVLDTVFGEQTVKFSVPASMAGGAPPFLAGSPAALLPGRDGQLVVRVPMKAKMQIGGIGLVMSREVKACGIKLFDPETGRRVKMDLAGNPGDVVVNDVATGRAYNIELTPVNMVWSANITTALIPREPSVESADPPVPTVGLPATFYDHPSGILKLMAPVRATSTVGASQVNYTVRTAEVIVPVGLAPVVTYGATLAAGTLQPGESMSLTLPPPSAIPRPQDRVITSFSIRDARGHIHETTTSTRRIGRFGFERMPLTSEPQLVASSQGRLVLRIAPRLYDNTPLVVASNTSVAYCLEPDVPIWGATTKGSGDVEMPAALVHPASCYLMTTNVTLADGTVREFKDIEKEMSLLGMGPLPITCPPRIVPRADGVIVVRSCNFDSAGENLDEWRESRLLLNVSDVNGRALRPQAFLPRGVDSVILTPCWETDCVLSIIYAFRERRETRQVYLLKAAQLKRYRMPNDPDVWTPTHNRLAIHNPTNQSLHVNVTNPDSGEEVNVSDTTTKGDTFIPGLQPNTRYAVKLEWSLLGVTATDTVNVHTPRAPGVSAASPTFNVMASPFELTVQIPGYSNSLAVAKAVAVVLLPGSTNLTDGINASIMVDNRTAAQKKAFAAYDSKLSNNARRGEDEVDDDEDDTARQLYGEDDGDAGSGGDSGNSNSSNGTNDTIGLGRKVLHATEVKSPAPGEHIRIPRLRSNTMYNVTVILTNVKGEKEILSKMVRTAEVAYSASSSHKSFKVAEDYSTTITVRPLEPIPDVLAMQISYNEWDFTTNKCPNGNMAQGGCPVMVVYNGPPSATLPAATGMTPGKQYVVKVSMIGSDSTDDRCTYITADAAAAKARKRKTPSVVRVTDSDVVIGLPSSNGISEYEVFQVMYKNGKEDRRALLYRGKGERSDNAGRVFIARGIGARMTVTFAVVPVMADMSSGKPIIMTATTDSAWEPCMVGRPTQPFEPTLLPKTLFYKSRKMELMFAPVETNMGDDTTAFPVKTYDMQIRKNGYNNEFKDTAAFKTKKTKITADTGLSYDQKNLIPGFTYTARVVAHNIFGPSAPGRESTFRCTSEEPEAPEPPELTPSTKSVAVSWSPPYHNGEPITGYRIDCSPPPAFSTSVYPSGQVKSNKTWGVAFEGGNTNSQPITGLVPATKYRCRVAAKNKVGYSKPSDPVAFSTYTDVPEQVPDLRSEQTGQYHVVLQWPKPRHNGLPITGYDTQMVEGAGSGHEAFTLAEECDDTANTQCVIGRLLPGTQYSFKVNSANCAGTSAWSKPLTLRTLAAPISPTVNNRMTESDIDSLTLSWDIGRLNGAPLIQHSVLCDDGNTCLTPPQWTPAQPEPPCVNYGPFQELNEAANENTTDAEKNRMFRTVWSRQSSGGDTSATAMFDGLRPATTYRCYAYSHNIMGRSNNSESALVFARTQDTIPSATTNLRVESEVYLKEQNIVKLLMKWDKATANGQAIIRTQMMRKTMQRLKTSTGMAVAMPPSGTVDQWEPVLDCAPECMFFAFDEGRPDTKYEFRVRTVNSLGASPWVIMQRTTEPGKPKPMLAPVLVEKDATSITVTCQDNDDGGLEINYYTVSLAQGVVSGGVSTADNDTSQFGAFEVKSEWSNMTADPSSGFDGKTAVKLDGLEQGTDYAVSCGSGNKQGMGEQSAVGVFATDAAPPDTPPAPTFVAKTPFQIDLHLAFPDDNGQRIDECTLWMGGAWEWCGNMAGTTCPGLDLFVPNFDEEVGGATGPPREVVRETVVPTYVPDSAPAAYEEMDWSSTQVTLPDSPCIECNVESSISDNPNDLYSYKSLQPGTMYCFKLKCTNAIGEGGYSNMGCFRTESLIPRTPAAARALSQTRSTAAIQLTPTFAYGHRQDEMWVAVTCVEGFCMGMGQGSLSRCDNLDASFVCQDDPPIFTVVEDCTTEVSDQPGEFDGENCPLAGLSAGTTYAIKFKARSSIGWSEESALGEFTTSPGEPLEVENVAATPQEIGAVDVTWTAPAYDSGSDIIAYKLITTCDNSKSQPSGSPCEDLPNSKDAGASDTTATVTHAKLKGGRYYKVAVAAENIVGMSRTNVVGAFAEFRMPATPPAGLSIKAGAPFADSINMLLGLPQEMNGGETLMSYEMQCAEAGATNWMPAPGGSDIHTISSGISMAGDTEVALTHAYWCEGAFTAACAGKNFWCRYRATSSGGGCTKPLGCGPSEWSRMSPPVTFRTSCPDVGGATCGGALRGNCNSVTGTCECVSGYGGADCSLPISTQTCDAQSNGFVALFNDLSLTDGVHSYRHGDADTTMAAEEGEFLMWKTSASRQDPMGTSERVHLRRYMAPGGTLSQIFDVAYHYGGHTVTLSTADAPGQCDVVRHNCINQMPADSDTSTVMEVGSNTLTVTRDSGCGGPITISNDFTGSQLTCQNSGEALCSCTPIAAGQPNAFNQQGPSLTPADIQAWYASHPSADVDGAGFMFTTSAAQQGIDGNNYASAVPCQPNTATMCDAATLSVATRARLYLRNPTGDYEDVSVSSPTDDRPYYSSCELTVDRPVPDPLHFDAAGTHSLECGRPSHGNCPATPRDAADTSSQAVMCCKDAPQQPAGETGWVSYGVDGSGLNAMQFNGESKVNLFPAGPVFARHARVIVADYNDWPSARMAVQVAPLREKYQANGVAGSYQTEQGACVTRAANWDASGSAGAQSSRINHASKDYMACKAACDAEADCRGFDSVTSGASAGPCVLHLEDILAVDTSGSAACTIGLTDPTSDGYKYYRLEIFEGGHGPAPATGYDNWEKTCLDAWRWVKADGTSAVPYDIKLVRGSNNNNNYMSTRARMRAMAMATNGGSSVGDVFPDKNYAQTAGDATHYCVWAASTDPTSGSAILEWEFPQKETFNGYKFMSGTGQNDPTQSALQGWTVYGSNDQDNWTPIDTQVLDRSPSNFLENSRPKYVEFDLPDVPRTLLNPVDAKRTFSTIHQGNSPGSGHGRSMLGSQQGWSGSAVGDWVDMDLDYNYYIIGTIVQTRHYHVEDQFLRRYTVQLRIDGEGCSTTSCPPCQEPACIVPTDESPDADNVCQNVWAAASPSGSGSDCPAPKTYPDALAHCATFGARLCTDEELMAGCAGADTMCSVHQTRVWTSTPLQAKAFEREDGLCGKQGLSLKRPDVNDLAVPEFNSGADMSLFNNPFGAAGQTCAAYYAAAPSLLELASETRPASRPTSPAGSQLHPHPPSHPPPPAHGLRPTLAHKAPVAGRRVSRAVPVDRKAPVAGEIDPALRPDHPYMETAPKITSPSYTGPASAAPERPSRPVATQRAAAGQFDLAASLPNLLSTRHSRHHTSHHAGAAPMQMRLAAASGVATGRTNTEIMGAWYKKSHRGPAQQAMPGPQPQPAYHHQHHLHTMALLGTHQAANSSAAAAAAAGAAGGAATQCPPGTDASACANALEVCKRFSTCFGSCIVNVLDSADVNASITKAERCEKRMLQVAEQAAKEAEEAADGPVEAPDHYTRFTMCPSRVEGDEPWNVAPYDAEVASWTADMIDGIVAAINAPAPANGTNGSNATNATNTTANALSASLGRAAAAARRNNVRAGQLARRTLMV